MPVWRRIDGLSQGTTYRGVVRSRAPRGVWVQLIEGQEDALLAFDDTPHPEIARLLQVGQSVDVVATTVDVQQEIVRVKLLADRARYLIRLSDAKSRDLATVLPADTLEFLRDSGVPELLVFCGQRHAFTLDMEALLDGAAFRAGFVRIRSGSEYRDRHAMAIQRTTGHFGYIMEKPEPTWYFCNSSVACFLSWRRKT